MSKKKKSKSKKRHSSSLKQHRQVGRRLSPPMKTLQNLKLTYWIKDDLPEMLWLSMLCAKYKYRGVIMARKVFDTVEQLLKEEYGDLDSVPKDIFVNGRLSTFDTLPEKLRPKVVQRLKLLGAYEAVFPREFGIALSRYDNPPAKWIWEYPKPAKGFSKDELKEAETLLRETVEAAWSGHNQTSTWAKIAVTSAIFSAGRITLTPEIAEEWSKLLPNYPNGLGEDDRKRVEASMRAMYQGVVMVPDEELTSAIDWAKEFWKTNWKLYDCETSIEPESMTVKEKTALAKFVKHLESRLQELSKEFSEVADTTDPDLYNPSRYEVLSGIVARSLRAVSVAVHDPHIWSTEHGSGLIRSLIEARIVLAWLLKRNDPELFEKFKDYGRGHLKLLKLHLEEYLDKQKQPNPELEGYIKALNEEVNWEISEEFQDIRVDANFAGDTNTRKMADEVGLTDDYRFIFAPASSAFHGEWPAVDQFALEVCKNPLHKGHKKPRKDGGVALGPQLMELALEQLNDLINRYKQGIQNNP